jgi:hypothetical protein
VREEVGVTLESDDLIPITDERSGSLRHHLYECRLAERPQIKIDNWEIVEARFLNP